MMYTRANTLARQEWDRQQNQVVGQPVVEAAFAKTSSSRQSSQNMPTLEHAMDLEDSLASQPFRGRTAQPTIAKMSGKREQATTRRGRLGFHASRTAPAMRRQDSPGAEGYFLLKRKQTGGMVAAYGMRTYLYAYCKFTYHVQSCLFLQPSKASYWPEILLF